MEHTNLDRVLINAVKSKSHIKQQLSLKVTTSDIKEHQILYHTSIQFSPFRKEARRSANRKRERGKEREKRKETKRGSIWHHGEIWWRRHTLSRIIGKKKKEKRKRHFEIVVFRSCNPCHSCKPCIWARWCCAKAPGARCFEPLLSHFCN